MLFAGLKGFGFFLFLLIIWWMVAFLTAIASISSFESQKTSFVLALVVLAGFFQGIPTILYLLISDLVARAVKPPWSICVYLTFVLAAAGAYLWFGPFPKGRSPATTFTDWLEQNGFLIAYGAVALIVLIRHSPMRSAPNDQQ